MPLLPKLPTFVEARELILTAETSRDADNKRAMETALLATGSTSQKADPSVLAPSPPDRSSNNTNNYNYGGRGRGHNRGGGRGRGGHDDGGCNGYNNAPFWPPTAPLWFIVGWWWLAFTVDRCHGTRSSRLSPTCTGLSSVPAISHAATTSPTFMEYYRSRPSTPGRIPSTIQQPG
jgi:hypothetical protein